MGAGEAGNPAQGLAEGAFTVAEIGAECEDAGLFWPDHRARDWARR